MYCILLHVLTLLFIEIFKTGKLLGTCSGINHNSNFSFIGLFAVLPQYQGLGIGSALWKKVLEHIGPERNISLFASNEMTEFYRRSGFGIASERRCQLYKGKVNCDQIIKEIKGITICRINEHNLSAVAKYDQEICDEFDRSVVVGECSKSLEAISLAAIEDETDRVVGYCVLSATNLNTGIAEPLYADSQQIAELLIGKCCDSLPITKTNGLEYQCWNDNDKAIAIAKKMGLTFLTELPILFTKQVVEGRCDKIFSVNDMAYYPC